MTISNRENAANDNGNIDVENLIRLQCADKDEVIVLYRELMDNEVAKAHIRRIGIKGHILFIRSTAKNLLDFIGVGRDVEKVIARQKELTSESSRGHYKRLEIRVIDKEKDLETFEKIREELKLAELAESEDQFTERAKAG